MIIDGWYCCPHCKQKLFKVADDASCKGVRLKCKKCGNEIAVTI